MSAQFNLPGSSIKELSKIIQAYGQFSEKVEAAQVARLAGVHRTTVSKNAKFLVDIGLLESGAQKAATEIGKKLSRALEHEVAADISEYWRQSISHNENVARLVTTIRIKGGMSEKEFSDHVLYVSGVKKTQATETGARTVVDVLLAAAMIEEKGGRLTVSSVESREDATFLQGAAIDESVGESQNATLGESTRKVAPIDVGKVSVASAPQVTINIQVHLPENADADTYDRIFGAIRENLFPPKDG